MYIYQIFSKIRGDIRKSRCTTSINPTGGKFAASVKYTGGTFATGILDTGSNCSFPIGKKWGQIVKGCMVRQPLKKNLRIDGKKKFALVSADPAVIHPLY